MDDNLPWLEERWAVARKEREAGQLKSVPFWFFDDVTDEQLAEIERIGFKFDGEEPTKGEASDIIGLFRSVKDYDAQILKFFKVPLKGMNHSKARHEVESLLANPDNRKAWDERPASQMQKEYYRFFNLPAPKSLGFRDAEVLIRAHQSELAEDEDNACKLEEWDTYESIFDDICDPEFREDNELKAISLPLYRSAINELRKDGKTLDEVQGDTDLLIEKLIELKPDIQK